ncbi:MAG: sigma-70 family RNA polymerase sigma factor [Bacteroidota bacterium]
MTEEELIIKLKAGDSLAFNFLIQSYATKVLNTCYRFFLDQQDAEDISQEVFLEVYQSIHSFRSDSKLSTWIYRIAITKSLDELKKRKRKKRISSFGKILHLDDISNWISGTSNADKNLLEKESVSEIMNSLDNLPENQRVALTLSKIEGYSNPEIAEIMQTTIGAVESLVFRAKKKLAEEIKSNE